MANIVLGAINLMIQQEIAKLPFRPYPMLATLPKASEFQSQIKWDVNVGGATVSGRAATADPTVQNTDTVVPASLPISNYVVDHTFSVLRSKLTELANLPPNMAPRALANLFRSHVNAAFDVIFPRLNTLIYTGIGDAGSQEVYGMNFVTTNTNTYAGLAPGTYTEWVSTSLGNAGTPRRLTKKLFADMSLALATKGVSYNAIITTPAVVQQYIDTFEKGIIIDGVTPMPIVNVNTTPNGTVDIGYSGFAYKGVPIIQDVTAPAGTMWFVDTSQVQFYTFAQGDYGSVSDSEINMVDCTNPEQTMGLNFLISELANTNPQVLKLNISVMPQLQVRNRKFVNVIRDIDETTTNIGVGTTPA
jgi:hypothetical protein